MAIVVAAAVYSAVDAVVFVIRAEKIIVDSSNKAVNHDEK